MTAKEVITVLLDYNPNAEVAIHHKNELWDFEISGTDRVSDYGLCDKKDCKDVVFFKIED